MSRPETLAEPRLKTVPIAAHGADTDPATTLSEEGLAVLMEAVQIARQYSIRDLKTLRRILTERGVDEGTILEALGFWAGYVQAKGSPPV